MVSFIDIIFLTILVAFIVSRLYGVFGSHANEKNIRVIIKPVEDGGEVNVMENIAKIIKENKDETLITAEINTPNQNSIKDFNKEKFLQGACRVFEMILQAFSSGNIENIKGLVSKKIWDAFNQVLTFRKENNITSEVDFICFKKSEIKDIKMLKNSVKVTVEFESEQINILKDADGKVIEGDENFVQNIVDVWTFERLFNAKNKNWTLVSTKKSA